LAVKVYPNPCKDEFKVFISLPVRSDVKISVNDITGQTLCTRIISDESPGPHIYYFNRNALNFGITQQGIGIITLETQQGIFHGKIVFRE
jgi:hypothetical protein